MSRNCATAIILAAGLAVLAAAASFAPGPTVVVSVNLEKMLDGLDARRAADENLQAIGRDLDGQIKALSDQVTELNEDLEVLKEGSEQWEAKKRELLQATNNYTTRIQFGEIKMDYEKAKVLKRLYDDIRAGAQRLSERKGYDLVIVNDNVGSIEPVGEQETMAQISKRRVLYHRPAMDVSSELIELMNSEFNAAANAATTP